MVGARLTSALGLREGQVAKPMSAKWKADSGLKTRKHEQGAVCYTSSLALQRLVLAEGPAVVAVATVPEALSMAPRLESDSHTGMAIDRAFRAHRDLDS